MTQAECNARDGLSSIRAAAAALHDITGLLTQMRALTLRPSLESIRRTKRHPQDEELQRLIRDIDRIAGSTHLDGIMPLTGAATRGAFRLGIDTAVLHAAASPQAATSVIDAALVEIAKQCSQLNATEKCLHVTLANVASARANVAATQARVRDAEAAEATAAMTRSSIVREVGVTVSPHARRVSRALSLVGD